MFRLNRNIPENIAMFGSLNVCKITPDLKTAIKLAELVLPIFENEHPNDDEPRKSIAAAKACLANPTGPQPFRLLVEANDPGGAARNAAYCAYNSAGCFFTGALYTAHWSACALMIKIVTEEWADELQSILKSSSWIKLCSPL